MLLVDIGNTSIQFAVERGGRIIKTFSHETAAATSQSIQKSLVRYPDEIMLVCSVVPRVTRLFTQLKRSRMRTGNIYVAGRDTHVPIRCFYDKKKVGMDRLVGAFAAKTIYPQTRLVIDFGTAIRLIFSRTAAIILAALYCRG